MFTLLLASNLTDSVRPLLVRVRDDERGGLDLDVRVGGGRGARDVQVRTGIAVVEPGRFCIMVAELDNLLNCEIKNPT